MSPESSVPQAASLVSQVLKADNQAVLKLHMDAVAEVSQIIVRCVRNASSDGTYAPAASQYGRDEW
jgi:hypothetical protein